MFGGADQSPINGGDPIKKLITDVTLVSEDVPMSVWFNQSTNCQDTVGTNVCVVKDPSHMQRSAMPLALAHHCSLPDVAACVCLKPFSLPGIFLQHLQAQNCRWLSPREDLPWGHQPDQLGSEARSLTHPPKSPPQWHRNAPNWIHLAGDWAEIDWNCLPSSLLYPAVHSIT